MQKPESDVREMLQRLGRALVAAAGGSNEVTDAVRRIRREGYSLYLVVDPSDEPPRGPQLELTTRPKSGSARGQAATVKARRQLPAPRRRPEASFRLDGDDAEFLRSVGIDPARSAARRRRNQGR